MSSDEEATIIGRMILERVQLTKQGALLKEELNRIGSQLSILGDKLKDLNPPYFDEPLQLTDTHYSVLDAPKIAELLAEAAEVSKRFRALHQNLNNVGA